MNSSTHNKGHILDLVITRDGSSLLKSLKVLKDSFSDHLLILTKLALPRPVLGKTVRTFRKLNNINVNSLYLDTSNSSISELDNEADVNILAQRLKDTLVELLDKHAPIVTKKITDRPNSPRYGEELRKIKVNKRRWERIYTKSKLCIHKQIYQETCTLYSL